MKFPKSALNIDEFNTRISDLLDQPDCSIFLDTNILALIYKLHATAREEFFEWIRPLIAADRIKTPVWAVSEYTNRFIRSQTSDYLSTLTKLKTFNKEFEEIRHFLEMNIDSKSLHKTSYATREDYLADLQKVTENLGKLSKATKDKSLDYILEIHDKIVDLFESTVLNSNIFKIIEEIEPKGSARFKNKIPPGFQDGTKDLNSFGDLIIWSEVLDYCHSNSIQKTIILTNDSKKDWVYAPKKIIENSRRNPNTNDFYKVIDTRLAYEYQLKTGSEDVHIINFDTLVNLLIKQGGKDLLVLAKAIQLINEQDEENVSDAETIDKSSQTTSASEAINEPPHTGNNTDGTEITDSEGAQPVNDSVEVENPPTAVLSYSTQATADATLPLDDQESFSSFIIGLKSYNWYTQNDQIDQLRAFLREHFNETQEIKDRLFVIGRNIYQAASGGAFRAMDFIEDLKASLSVFGDATANHIYSGMFYEVYFNSSGEFRKENFKTAFHDQLFKLQTDGRFSPAINFMKGSLNPYSDYLLVTPSLTPETITIQINYEIKETNEFFGKINSVTSIKALDRELLHPNVDDHFIHAITEDKTNLENIIKHVFVIPSNQVKFEYIPELNEPYYFYIPATKVLKLATIHSTN